MPGKPPLNVFLYSQDPCSTLAPSLPVTMTWRCGRTSHVLPEEWLAQRKTSDHPWRKLALRSANSKIKNCVPIELQYVKLICAAKPCEINLQRSTECPLTAT